MSLLSLATQSFAADPAGGSKSRGRDSRSDRISDQEDAIDAASTDIQQHESANQPAPPSPPEFNFRITTPLYYNSNAQQSQSNGSAALEGDPEVELGWSRSLTSVPLKLSVRLRADTDRFAGVPQADEDQTSATFKAQYYDVANDQALAPFVSYKGALLFQPTFSPWTQTKNDFTVGLAKLFNFDESLHPLPLSARSSADAVWDLSLSTSIQRRLRTPGANSTALINSIAISYDPVADWDFSLGLDATQRWFDTVMIRNRATTRRDFKLEPLLTIAWASSAASLGSPVIALQVGFERQSSNLSRKSYSQWTVGPVLTAGWRF